MKRSQFPKMHALRIGYSANVQDGGGGRRAPLLETSPSLVWLNKIMSFPFQLNDIMAEGSTRFRPRLAVSREG